MSRARSRFPSRCIRSDLRRAVLASAALLLAVISATARAGEGSTTASAAAAKKPNIVVLWGDDIGVWNVSAYSQGMMGYRTPNIDRIAREGALFTDWYGQ